MQNGELRLERPSYVPPPREAQGQYLDILGQATSTLIDTVDFNTRPECPETRLQGLAFNGRIPASKLVEVAHHIKERGRSLVYEIDDYLYQASVPRESSTDEPLLEAGVSIYFFRKDAVPAFKGEQ